MAQRLTLQQLRDHVGFATDVTIGGTRYPNAMVDLWINQAIQACQLLKHARGLGDESVTTVAGTATDVAQPGGYLAREVISLPTDFLAQKSVFVKRSTTERYQLEALAESDRVLDTLYTYGMPRYYSLLDATQAGTARLKLWPPADISYSYEVTYVPEHPTLTAVGDLWEHAPGTEDLVICDAAKRLLDRDGVPEPQQYQALDRRYGKALDALDKYAQRDNQRVLSVRNTKALAARRWVSR